MTEQYPAGNNTQSESQPGFDAFSFSEEVRADPELMAEAVQDVGARVSDFIEQYPETALNPEFEGKNQYIQHSLGNLAFVREAIDDGRITGVKKEFKRRLEVLEEDAEDMLTAIGDVDVDPHKDPVRQLERVFADGHWVSEALAPDLAAEVMEASKLIGDIAKSEKVKMPGARSYLSKKIAVAASRAIELPIRRDEWNKAA